MERILVVDDELGIRMVLRGVLESAGYDVDEAPNGEVALDILAKSGYDLLLVDLQMAELDGLDLVKQARAANPTLATIILTGFATANAAITALKERVDDFLVKPADPETIRQAVQQALARRRADRERAAALARISSDLQALLGSPPTGQAATTAASPSPPTGAGEADAPAVVVTAGPLSLDPAAHQALWHGQPLALTPIQFKLLAYLAEHAGQVQSPQQLVAAVQGYESSPAEARELIKPHLYSLRAVLEPDPANPRYLINIRGVGYLLRLEQGAVGD